VAAELRRAPIILAALGAFALSACAQPAPRREPQPMNTDWYAQKKCPAIADCMPGPDAARAERCAWVKQNCPDTQIVY